MVPFSFINHVSSPYLTIPNAYQRNFYVIKL